MRCIDFIMWFVPVLAVNMFTGRPIWIVIGVGSPNENYLI